MALIEAILLPNIEEQNKTNGDPNCKTSYIYKAVEFVFYESSPGDFDVVDQHKSLFPKIGKIPGMTAKWI